MVGHLAIGVDEITPINRDRWEWTITIWAPGDQTFIMFVFAKCAVDRIIVQAGFWEGDLASIDGGSQPMIGDGNNWTYWPHSSPLTIRPLNAITTLLHLI